jgi:hypothetical protein
VKGANFDYLVLMTNLVFDVEGDQVVVDWRITTPKRADAKLQVSNSFQFLEITVTQNNLTLTR